jgi:hypothetical protein
MESGHGDAAILLIEAGADRTRVRESCRLSIVFSYRVVIHRQIKMEKNLKRCKELVG